MWPYIKFHFPVGHECHPHSITKAWKVQILLIVRIRHDGFPTDEGTKVIKMPNSKSLCLRDERASESEDYPRKQTICRLNAPEDRLYSNKLETLHGGSYSSIIFPFLWLEIFSVSTAEIIISFTILRVPISFKRVTRFIAIIIHVVWMLEKVLIMISLEPTIKRGFAVVYKVHEMKCKVLLLAWKVNWVLIQLAGTSRWNGTK